MRQEVGPAKVMVVGSANMDLVFRCPRLPAPGETLLGGEFRTAPGGKGANQAVAIGRLGGYVELVAKLGTDSFGNALLASLTSAGVGINHALRTTEAPTGVAAVIVGAGGENSIVVAPGANAHLAPRDVTQALSACRPTVILAQLEVPLEAVQACAGPALFVLNPAPAMKLSDEFLGKIDVITPNETETLALTGIDPTDEFACSTAAANLHDRGVKTVVLTLGARGCFVSDEGSSKHYDSLPVVAVDTTAAGDAFSGALAHFLSTGRDIWNSAQLAGFVGALCTTQSGAQESMPSLEMLRKVAEEIL